MSLFDFARQEAQRQGVDPDLVYRTMRQESGGNPSALSPKGARGPMQLMPATARELGVDPNDAQDNIRGGVKYLKQQLDRFGSPELALAAYNAGPAAVQRAGGVPNYPETQKYVRSIMGGQPRSGADIFGADTAPQQAAQGGSGADIFADPAPPTAAATTAPGPREIAASHNRGVTIDAEPMSAPAPAQAAPVSQRLGFERGFAKPYAKAGELLGDLGSGLGLHRPDWLSAMARNLQAGQATAEAAHPEVYKATPGKTGQFLGNMASTSYLPGGPATSGALTGLLLSDKKDVGGMAGDTLAGMVGGKLGSAVIGGAGKLVKGLTGDALALANKGVPLTPGQMMGGWAKGAEDKLTSVPVLGDVIRNAQRRGIAGANRAAFNDTLAHVDEALPAHVETGSDAYSYTKQRLGDLYDEVLDPLTVARDTPWSQAFSAAKAKIGKIGDPTVRANALNILKTTVQSRFDKAGNMVGRDLKDVQSDLGSHINDLTAAGAKTWDRKAGAALKDVKAALEDLVGRTDAQAGDRLAKVNTAYAHLKPLETATAKAGVKGEGIFNMNQLSQGVTKGKAASTVAAGKAPHQELAGAAARLLPSSVPDSGTAGRLMAPAVLAGLLSGHLPIAAAAAPVAVPAAGLIGGTAALYTRGGQKALTALMSSRNPTMRSLGEQLSRLSGPAGSAGAVALTGARQ